MAKGFLTTKLDDFILHRKLETSVGWADMQDIERAGLTIGSGVVLGINPYTHKLLVDNSQSNVLIIGPDLAGKGINTLIPTGFTWEKSAVFFDYSGDIWNMTASYRQKVLHQKVLKFAPLNTDGLSVRWNPLAEISFRESFEILDASAISSVVLRLDDKQLLGAMASYKYFFRYESSIVLENVILHLLYAHYKEGKPFPCLTDVAEYLPTEEESTELFLKRMRVYPHITSEEFLSDHNPLEEIYGEYIKDFRIINERYVKPLGEKPVCALAELKEIMKKHGHVNFDEDACIGKDDYMDEWLQNHPLRVLLVHPYIAKSISQILQFEEVDRMGFFSILRNRLKFYQDPVIQRNTETSDFCIYDLLNSQQPVSVYLWMKTCDMGKIEPLSRLFVRMIYHKASFGTSYFGRLPKNGLLMMLNRFSCFGYSSDYDEDDAFTGSSVFHNDYIKTCVFAESVEQLYRAGYSSYFATDLFRIHLCFTPFPGDFVTIKKMIELGAAESKKLSIKEIERMPYKKGIVFLANGKPIFIDKFRWQLFFKTFKPAQDILQKSDQGTAVKEYSDLFVVQMLVNKI